MSGFLRLLREHEEAVEADLARYYHVDYRDRWRRDAAGRRLLTLRMIRARVKYLPPQSAVGQVLKLDTGFTVGDYLLTDIFKALTGKTHPARPKATPQRKVAKTTRRAGQVAAAKRRKKAREEQIARGELK